MPMYKNKKASYKLRAGTENIEGQGMGIQGHWQGLVEADRSGPPEYVFIKVLNMVALRFLAHETYCMSQNYLSSPESYGQRSTKH